MTSKPCTFPECDKPHYARGLCKGHYFQDRRGQRLRPLGQPCNAKPWAQAVRVTLALPAADTKLLAKMARSHKVSISELVTRLVLAALDQGVEIEI